MLCRLIYVYGLISFVHVANGCQQQEFPYIQPNIMSLSDETLDKEKQAWLDSIFSPQITDKAEAKSIDDAKTKSFNPTAETQPQEKLTSPTFLLRGTKKRKWRIRGKRQQQSRNLYVSPQQPQQQVEQKCSAVWPYSQDAVIIKYRHNQPIECPIPSCDYMVTNGRSVLKAHLKNKHQILAENIICKEILTPISAETKNLVSKFIATHKVPQPKKAKLLEVNQYDQLAKFCVHSGPF